MTTNLYQLYDKVAEQVSGPIMSIKKDGPAIRHFHALLATNDTMPGRYPDNFELWKVGEQNEESGEITCVMHVVATGAAWKEGQETASANPPQLAR